VLSPLTNTNIVSGDPRGATDRELSVVRVLIASNDASLRDRLRRAMNKAGMSCCAVRTPAAACERLAGGAGVDQDGQCVSYDVVVVDAALSDEPAAGLAPFAEEAGTCLVLVAGPIDAEGAIAAVRAGVADIVQADAMGELLSRVKLAAAKSRCGRRQQNRIVKLKRMCRRLNSAREQVARQAEALCTDLVQAYQELADHMSQVTTATEFKGLIRNELDIESLLRTTLEYVLSRTGPTNAAIFLPTTTGDYSLGAYVNYDCPKETVDILLDHMANVVAPRFESLTGLLYLPEQAGLDRYIGDDAQWLDDSGVVALACKHENETLAIFMLFRDRKHTYNAPLLEQITTIGELFAAQLARVIHIHHRHLPKHKWGMLGDPEHGADDGYGDLAA